MEEWRKTLIRSHEDGLWAQLIIPWPQAGEGADVRLAMPPELADRILADHKAAEELAKVKAEHQELISDARTEVIADLKAQLAEMAEALSEAEFAWDESEQTEAFYMPKGWHGRRRALLSRITQKAEG